MDNNEKGIDHIDFTKVTSKDCFGTKNSVILLRNRDYITRNHIGGVD